jgi:hypothetical protein
MIIKERNEKERKEGHEKLGIWNGFSEPNTFLSSQTIHQQSTFQGKVCLGCFLPTFLRFSPNLCNLYTFTDLMRLRTYFPNPQNISSFYNSVSLVPKIRFWPCLLFPAHLTYRTAFRTLYPYSQTWYYAMYRVCSG